MKALFLSQKRLKMWPQLDLSFYCPLNPKGRFPIQHFIFLSTIVKITECLQMGWYSLFHLISCSVSTSVKWNAPPSQSFPDFSQDSVMSCRRFLEAMKSRLTLLHAKFSHVYKGRKCKTLDQGDPALSLYKRQTLAYTLLCKMQKVSGLQFRILGGAQPLLEMCSFLNSPSHKSHRSTAKP